MEQDNNIEILIDSTADKSAPAIYNIPSLQDHAHTRMPSWFKTKLQETLVRRFFSTMLERRSSFLLIVAVHGTYVDESTTRQAPKKGKTKFDSVSRNNRSESILLDIDAWLFGESVECRGFQNYSMQRLIHLLHFQRFLLTPEAYTRIRASTPPKSALKRLVNNMVARHWGSKTIDISTLKVICNGSRSLLHVLDFCASLL
jgi:hypothetical protein